MKKNNIVSSKHMILFCTLALIIFFIAVILTLYLFIKCILELDITCIIIFGTLFLLFTSLLILDFIMLNRTGCIINYDENLNSLSRKGLLIGFKSKMLISNIKEVEIVFINKECEYIILKDTKNTSYNGLSKKSYFKIENNQKNLEFVKQFWKGPIKNVEKTIW